MAETQLNSVLHQIRTVELCRQGATDGALLARFIESGDGAAFEALVRRHAPMVLGVCRRVLRNQADADDAFQATFVVLVRKARTLRGEGLANWLYGVAHNTALKARAMTRLRRDKERRAGPYRSPHGSGPDAERERLLDQLDIELRRLPGHQRTPIILCDLEGHTIQEAAATIGCPAGTVASRLARGRALLARRLSRHSPKLSVGALVTLLAESSASASVPAPLLTSVVGSGMALATGSPLAAGAISAPVAHLTQGVLKMMLLNKLVRCGLALAASAATAVCAVALAATVSGPGGVPLSAQAVAPRAPVPPAAPAPAGAKEADDAFAAELLPNRLVRAELKLTDEQSKALDQAYAPVQKELDDAVRGLGANPDDRELLKLTVQANEKMAQASREVYKTALKPEQVKRLGQIGLQVRGAPAYTSPRVVNALKLSEDQKKQAAAIVEGYSKAMRKWVLAATADGVPAPPGTPADLDRIAAASAGLFDGLLTKDQRAVWKEMIGTVVPPSKLMP